MATTSESPTNVQNFYQREQRHHRSQEFRRAFVCLGASGIGDHSTIIHLRWHALVEYFRIPRDVLTICVGKSNVRGKSCGIIVNVTPFEPEWEGFVTLEISNTTPLPAKVYANEGLCQILFFKGDQPCETSYVDRKGKSSIKKQQGIVLLKLYRDVLFQCFYRSAPRPVDICFLGPLV